MILHVSTSYENVPNLVLIEKVRKGGKKGSSKGEKKKEDSGFSSQQKKNLRHIKCFNCNKHVHYCFLVL